MAKNGIEAVTNSGNSGSRGTASMSTSGKVAIVAGSGDGYDSVGGNIGIYVNNSWVTCNSSNGTYEYRTIDIELNNNAFLAVWVNNKHYADAAITQVRCINNDSNACANVCYFKIE